PFAEFIDATSLENFKKALAEEQSLLFMDSTSSAPSASAAAGTASNNTAANIVYHSLESWRKYHQIFTKKLEELTSQMNSITAAAPAPSAAGSATSSTSSSASDATETSAMIAIQNSQKFFENHN